MFRISVLIWLLSCSQCNFFRSFFIRLLIILLQSTVCCAFVGVDVEFLLLRIFLSFIIHVLKPANLLKTLSRYSSLDFVSCTFLDSIFPYQTFVLTSLHIYNLPLSFSTTIHWLVSKLAPLKVGTWSIHERCGLSDYVSSSQERFLFFYIYISVWENQSLEKLFFYVAKLSNIIVIACSYKISLPQVGLEIYLFPSFGLKCPRRIFTLYLGNW
jgi:hypothetical protein